MSKTSDVLNLAADYIDRGWTQGALARRKNGARADPNSPDAVSWCALGAIQRAQYDLKIPLLASQYAAIELIVHKAAISCGFRNIAIFNDETAETAEEVSALLRKVAKNA
jgi:hypothetical protein